MRLAVGGPEQPSLKRRRSTSAEELCACPVGRLSHLSEPGRELPPACEGLDFALCSHPCLQVLCRLTVPPPVPRVLQPSVPSNTHQPCIPKPITIFEPVQRIQQPAPLAQGPPEEMAGTPSLDLPVHKRQVRSLLPGTEDRASDTRELLARRQVGPTREFHPTEPERPHLQNLALVVMVDEIAESSLDLDAALPPTQDQVPHQAQDILVSESARASS
mmetsp:Transcript_45679/g.129331  ORF Transcript_45679/g.129331 Transcript_45679/m.129331 type:complete len:217 (-) Transcript_45679:498-1148(-)